VGGGGEGGSLGGEGGGSGQLGCPSFACSP
jgi:hypothetical protein